MEWARREDGVRNYGAGDFRQVLADDSVVVSTLGASVEWRDPLIDKHHDAFCFRLMDASSKRPRPILGIGLKKHPDPPDFNKLKLKFMQDIEKLHRKAGPDADARIKEDGASAKGRGTQHGTSVWSPRVSKTTGEQINYTWKLRDWQTVEFEVPTEFKGEVMLLDIKAGEYLSAAEVAGQLNSNSPLPSHIKPEYVIYSVDRIGRQDMSQVPHSQALQYIEAIADKHEDWRVATPVDMTINALTHAAQTHEGIVVVPDGGTIADHGIKLKLRHDTYDWRLKSIDFKPGPKSTGSVAGVAWFQSEESGRDFKIGPSSVGDRDVQLAMMRNPEAHLDRVYVVECFNGHEGRAAKVLHEHPDKGRPS
jgi:hypothetical protein